MAVKGGIMRTVLRRIASDPTSLHGGRRGKIRSDSTHRLEGPWQRMLVRHPDPGEGCSLPTAACRTSSILRFVARSTIYRDSSRKSHQCDKHGLEPEKRQQSRKHLSQADQRRDWKQSWPLLCSGSRSLSSDAFASGAKPIPVGPGYEGRHVPPEKRRSEPEKRQQSGNLPSQAEKRRDWKQHQRT